MDAKNRKLCVLVVHPRADQYAEIIRKRFPETRIITANLLSETEGNQILENVEDVDIVVAATALPYSLPRIRALKWFQALSAGYEHILKHGLISRETIFTNAAGVAAIPVSETVMGYMLNFVKKSREMWERQKKKTLLRIPDETGELHGKTIGVLGLGNLGRAVAKKAKQGFDMRVLGYDVAQIDDPNIDAYYSQEQLELILEESDFVVITLPLTPKTQEMIGEEEFTCMKRTAYFINVARAEIVIRGALVRALKEKWIAGAALDVYWGDPTTNLLPPEDELWQLDNIILTPHSAGVTDRYLPRAFDLFCRNLEKYIKGEELLNIITER